MSHRVYVCSDHHIGHGNILTFKRNDGTPLRDFKSLEEMHECIVDSHNSVVRDVDTVVFLGDVVINRKYAHILTRMKGKKRLVHGNHDLMTTEEYLKYFGRVQGVRVYPYQAVLTHVPLHPECLERESWGLNIHGHLHDNSIMLNPHTKHPKYINVSVEQINYTPVELDSIAPKRNKS